MSGQLYLYQFSLLGQWLLGIQYMDLFVPFFIHRRVCFPAFFFTSKSLLPGGEAIHCGGVEPVRDLHMLVGIFPSVLFFVHRKLRFVTSLASFVCDIVICCFEDRLVSYSICFALFVIPYRHDECFVNSVGVL